MDNQATPGVPRGAAWRPSVTSGYYYLPACILDPFHEDCARNSVLWVGDRNGGVLVRLIP